VEQTPILLEKQNEQIRWSLYRYFAVSVPQVQRLAPLLGQKHSDRFDKFVVAVKEKLIDSQRLSSVSRACLTFLIDFAGHGLVSFPAESFYSEFYASRGVPLSVLNYVSVSIEEF
jgi:hypothetical protein